MKKILLIILTIMTTLAFSHEMKNKKNDIELKTMIRTGFNPLSKSIALVGEVAAYKTYRFEKPDVMVNVGGGIDVGASIRSENTKYLGLVRPYFATEIGGYVNKDTRMYTDIKLGVGAFIRESLVEAFPKASVSLGMTYKEHFTIEVAGNFPGTFSIGLGSRFGF